MKDLILKLAGVRSEEEFYSLYPTQEIFFEKHPEAVEIINNYKQSRGIENMANGGGMSNNIPIQAETYQGQAEQVVLPDNTIKSVEATTSHENMEDDTVTDVLPEGSHIQSARNKLSPDQYAQLMQMFKPETAEQDIKKLAQVYQNKYGKKNGKKLSPADISEYAKNKYQTESTPNAFDTDKLKEGNKKAYLELSMQMNDLIKSGKEIAEGKMPEQNPMMAWGGSVNKYVNGTPKKGVTREKVSLSDKQKELELFKDILNINPNGVIDYPLQHASNANLNLYDLSPEEYQNRMKFYEQVIPGLSGRFFSKDQSGNYSPPTKENTVNFQKAYDEYVSKISSKLSNTYSPEQISSLQSLLKFNNNLDPSAKLYDSKMGQFTSSRSGFKFPIFPKETVDRLNKMGITNISQAINKGLLSPEEETLAREEVQKYGEYGILPLPTPQQNVPIPATLQPPGEKVASPQLGATNPVSPAARIPMQNRFNYGLLEGQLGRGLSANQAMLDASMSLSPLYVMETPDTYIRSRKNEIPVGNILYNIEKAQRNTANALSNQTGDWSTLAGNIANAGANAYNQIGDTLSALNEKNIGLYNQTQDLQQGLLASNMGVRNQNLTNMQNMLNFKRNLLGQKAVKDAELYSNYAKSMSENAQKEQNQKMELLNIMASKPDMFRGEQGQRFANQIMGNYGSYNNPFAGTLLNFI